MDAVDVSKKRFTSLGLQLGQKRPDYKRRALGHVCASVQVCWQSRNKRSANVRLPQVLQMSRLSSQFMADKVKSRRAKPSSATTPSPTIVSSVSSEMGSSEVSVEFSKMFKDIQFAKVEDKFTVVVEYDSLQQVLRLQFTNEMTKNVFIQQFNRKNIHKITDRCKLQPDLVVKMLIDTLGSKKLTAQKIRIFVFDDPDQATSKYKEFQSMKRVPSAKVIPSGFHHKGHPQIESTASFQSMILDPQSGDGQERCLLLVLHFSAPPYIFHNYGFIIPGVYVSEFERLAMKMDDLQRDIRSLQNSVYGHSKKFSDVFQRMDSLNEINGVLTQRFLLHQIEEKVQCEPKGAVTPRLSQTKPALMDIKSCPARSPSPQVPAPPAPTIVVIEEEEASAHSNAYSHDHIHHSSNRRPQSAVRHRQRERGQSQHHRGNMSMSRLSETRLSSTPFPTELSMDPFPVSPRYRGHDRDEEKRKDTKSTEDSERSSGRDRVDEMRLHLKNGWTRYNEQWSAAKAIRVGHIVYLSGLIKGGVTGHIATLPIGWRPSHQKMYCQATNGDQTRVDILADGRIYQQTQFWSFLSLEGMSFVICR